MSGARRGWNALGAVVAALVVIGGLVLAGFVVLIAVGMSNWGSNK